MGKKGVKQSEEHKRNISRARLNRKESLGYLNSKETREKLSKANKGHKPWIFGRRQSEESKKKMSESQKGKVLSAEHRARISDSEPRGDKHWNWQGGKSLEEYSVNWTETLKRSIRERDHYTCQLCGRPQGDIALDVHHIDHGKTNNNPNNLVALCHVCHAEVSRNRGRWDKYFNRMEE